MPIAHLSYRYLITLAVFFAFDMLWLGVLAEGFYSDRLGHLMGPVNWIAALLFYLTYVAGIVYFALLPALKNSLRPVGEAALRGGVLGLVAYATYDLTNLATLKGWPLDLVVVDMAWGTVLTAAVAAVSCHLGKVMGLK